MRDSLYISSSELERRLRIVVGRITEAFELWGYAPISVPRVDYADLYNGLLPNAVKERAYQTIDRNGDVMLLCPDATLFVARQIALMLDQQSPLPLRLFYCDAIMHRRTDRDFDQFDSVQCGVELIGSSEMDAELEPLLLLQEILDTTDASDWHCHIGSRALLDEIAKEERMSLPVETLRRIIFQRDWEKLYRILVDNGAHTDRAETIIALFSYIGDDRELVALFDRRKKYISDREQEIVHLLIDCYQKLQTAGMSRIRLDLSEIGAQSYYSGIAFEVYTRSCPCPIASGGRYDNLLSQFKEINRPISAIGFTLFLRTIEGVIDGPPPNAPIKQADGNDIIERYRNASAERKKGLPTVL